MLKLGLAQPTACIATCVCHTVGPAPVPGNSFWGLCFARSVPNCCNVLLQQSVCLACLKRLPPLLLARNWRSRFCWAFCDGAWPCLVMLWPSAFAHPDNYCWRCTAQQHGSRQLFWRRKLVCRCHYLWQESLIVDGLQRREVSSCPCRV